MPFRRKCADEIPLTRVVIPYSRGEIGPFLTALSGYDPGRPVPFGADDPDGVEHLARARDAKTRAEEAAARARDSEVRLRPRRSRMAAEARQEIMKQTVEAWRP